MLADTASRANKEGHVREGFGDKPRVPSLWVELFGVFPVLGAVMQDVFAKHNPDAAFIDYVSTEFTFFFFPGLGRGVNLGLRFLPGSLRDFNIILKGLYYYFIRQKWRYSSIVKMSNIQI